MDLMSLVKALFGGIEGLDGLDGMFNLSKSAPSLPALPRQPTGLCKGKSGMELVVCQRYIETLPTTEEISGGKASRATPSSGGGEFRLEGGYNLYMISKYATKVQNQGSEGACTAFGNAHVLGVLARIKGKSGEYDAWKIWSAQGKQPNMDASLAAAKRMDFDGLRISSAREFDVSVQSLKAQLNAGRPVYYGSDVNRSWHGTGRGEIGCTGAKTGAHAYTIMGYDDNSQVFVIKNSWGDSWGDQGYAYLKYDCIGRQGWTSAYDIQLQ
jgi:C1A family cysteine protease